MNSPPQERDNTSWSLRRKVGALLIAIATVWSFYTQIDDILGLQDLPEKVAARSEEFAALIDLMPGWAWGALAWTIVAGGPLVLLGLFWPEILALLHRLIPPLVITWGRQFPSLSEDEVARRLKVVENAADALIEEVIENANTKVREASVSLETLRRENLITEGELRDEIRMCREKYELAIAELARLKEPALRFLFTQPPSTFNDPLNKGIEVVTFEVHARGAVSVQDVEVRIASVVPVGETKAPFSFNAVEPLEVQRGIQGHNTVYSGRPMTVQIFMLRKTSTFAAPEVRVWYAHSQIILLYPPLPEGTWEIIIVATGSNCPPAEQKLQVDTRRKFGRDYLPDLVPIPDQTGDG